MPRILYQNNIESIPSKAFNFKAVYSDEKTELSNANQTSISQIINFDLSSNPLGMVDLDAFVQMPKLRKLYAGNFIFF